MSFGLNHFLISLAVISYGMSQFLFSLTFSIQIAGVLNQSKNTAASFENIMNIGSTAMMAAFLPAITYLVEQELSLKPYLLIVAISLNLSFFCHILLRRNLAFITAYFLTVIRAYQRERSMPKAMLLVGVQRSDFKTSSIEASGSLNQIKDQFSLKYFLASFVFTIPIASGVFISFLFALLFPDNRLLLSQTSILIHGFGQFFYGTLHRASYHE
ncbi:DUF2837 family protein [Alphaproteobacteria bacterium]|nr:DUF2837 family protein [Alphaproteobacteria bacterium]